MACEVRELFAEVSNQIEKVFKAYDKNISAGMKA
jgi:hypothetical protein